MQCQKQIHSLLVLQCRLSPGWGLCFSCVQFLIRILWFLLLQNRTLFNQVLMGGSTAQQAEQWFESPGFYFQLHCWLAVHPALGRSKAEWMALHLTTFSVCTALDGKQIRHLALSLEELWSLENRCVVTLCLLFKAKEQNKLSEGGEWVDREWKKSNNLLNNRGVKGALRDCLNHSGQRRLFGAHRRGQGLKYLQIWTIAGLRNSACRQGLWTLGSRSPSKAVCCYQDWPVTERSLLPE